MGTCPYIRSECLKTGCEAYEPPETDTEGETIGDYCNIIEGHTELIGLSDELANQSNAIINLTNLISSILTIVSQKLVSGDGKSFFQAKPS